VTARIHTFRGIPAVTLSGGDYRATTFLPELGMLGTSLRWRDDELLSLHGGLDGWRAGHTTGMPLLAPWANRLGGSRFKVGHKQLDLTDANGVHVDVNESPIHGLLLGPHVWTVHRVEDDNGDRARLATSFAFDEHPHLLDLFPFPHRLEVEVTVDRDGLGVETAVVATGHSAVPVSFGWHPYFRLPGVSRRDLVVGLPARRRLEVNDRQIPTGHMTRAQSEEAALGDRTFDDGYRLGRTRRFTMTGPGLTLAVSFDARFPYAQVFAPAGKSFVAFEPMTAPTNALLTGEVPWVLPGERFAARFQMRVDGS
jgi:aldose 1-epimerase